MRAVSARMATQPRDDRHLAMLAVAREICARIGLRICAKVVAIEGFSAAHESPHGALDKR